MLCGSATYGRSWAELKLQRAQLENENLNQELHQSYTANTELLKMMEERRAEDRHEIAQLNLEIERLQCNRKFGLLNM